MPAIKVADFAFPRMEAPDLDRMEEFLTHFGLASRRDLPGIDDLKAAGLLDPLDESVFQLQLESEEQGD